MSKGKGQGLTFEAVINSRDAIRQAISRMSEMASKEEALSPFIDRLRKIAQFVEDVHQKNVKLLDNIQQMNDQIVLNAQKVQMIQSNAKKGVGNIAQLKEEFQQASQSVKAAFEREAKAKEALKSLRENLLELAKAVSNGGVFSFGEDGPGCDVFREVENLTAECERGRRDINELKGKIEGARQALDGCGKAQQALKGEEKTLTVECEETEKQIENVEAQIVETTADVKAGDPKIKGQEAALEQLGKKKEELVAVNEERRKDKYLARSDAEKVEEELKARKRRIEAKVKQLEELKKTAFEGEKRLEYARERVKEKESELGLYQKDVTAQEKDGKALSEQYELLKQQKAEMEENMVAAEKKVRELRPQLVKLSITVVQSDNTNKLKTRKVTATKLQVNEEKQKYDDEKRATADVVRSTKGLQTERTVAKKDMQGMKNKLLAVYKEIDKAREQAKATKADSDALTDKGALCEKENVAQKKELAAVTAKCQKQAELTEELRQEKSASQKQLRALQKENEVLARQNADLEKELSELNEKLDSVLRDTAVKHFAVRQANDDVDLMNQHNKEYQEGVFATQRICARLETEVKTLHFILREAENDHVQQKKECEICRENKFVVGNDVIHKKQLLEDLRTEIRVAEAKLKTSAINYEKQKQEVVRLAQEYQHVMDIASDLDQKYQKLQRLQTEYQALSAAQLLEQSRFMALNHEFATVRNVHRWHIIESVEPGYYKNICLRNSLSAKINEKHAELLALRGEKEQLEQKVRRMKALHEATALSKEEAAKDIRKYKDGIKRMDEELNEMRSAIKENKSLLSRDTQMVTETQERLNDRKSKAFAVKNDIASLKAAEAEDLPTCWFVTEPPIVKPELLGGGFNMRPGPAHSSLGTVQQRPTGSTGRRSVPTSLQVPLIKAKKNRNYFAKPKILPPL